MQNLQQAQIEFLLSDIVEHQLEKISISELSGGYYLSYHFFSRLEQKTIIATLYTQKNKIRVFKTLDASYKHVKHLAYLFNGDGKVIGLNDVSITLTPDFF